MLFLTTSFFQEYFQNIFTEICENAQWNKSKIFLRDECRNQFISRTA